MRLYLSDPCLLSHKYKAVSSSSLIVSNFKEYNRPAIIGHGGFTRTRKMRNTSMSNFFKEHRLLSSIIIFVGIYLQMLRFINSFGVSFWRYCAIAHTILLRNYPTMRKMLLQQNVLIKMRFDILVFRTVVHVFPFE